MDITLREFLVIGVNPLFYIFPAFNLGHCLCANNMGFGGAGQLIGLECAFILVIKKTHNVKILCLKQSREEFV